MNTRHQLMLFIAISMQGCAMVNQGPGRAVNATEKMMWSTYLVGTKIGAATAFAVSWKDPRNGGQRGLVLMTSSHVLTTAGKAPLLVVVRIASPDGDPTLAVLQLTQRGKERVRFIRHPTEDIAAFAVRNPTGMAELATINSFLPEEKIARERLSAGTDVSFLGFPEVFPGTSGGFPVLRSGKVASYPARDAGQEEKFLINADVYPGDSGAPVFRAGGGKQPELAGMIIRRVGDKPEDFAHFAIAVNNRAILETLSLLRVAEARLGRVGERESRRIDDPPKKSPSAPGTAREGGRTISTIGPQPKLATRSH